MNYQIAQHYISAGGKTRALFGLIELSYLSYEIILFAFGVLSFLIAAFRLRKNWDLINGLTFFLSLISIALILIPFWRIWI
ncbi:hypothetical protein [Pedobacter frigiditerrae]|uniref:hypothetical protein n=1 Tax=Pedobacter frigiditerrae TaxID=2530452 RepID=UPI00292D57F9|nr:hypothetical protein [Pedobacter frigiditerrae]